MSPTELKEIIAVLYKNRKLIAMITGSCIVLGLLAMFLLRPAYEVKINMLLKGNPLTEILAESDFKATADGNKEGAQTLGQATTPKLDKYLQRFIDYLGTKDYRKILYARLYADKRFVRDSWQYTYVRVIDQYPLTVEVSLQAGSDRATRSLADIFMKTISSDYKELVTSGNAEKLALIENEVAKVTQELARLEGSMTFEERKFKHIDMSDYIKSQEEMLRMLTVEENINAENVHANPVVAKLRERVAELEKEVFVAGPEKKAAAKVQLQDAKERYNTALYLVKTKVADGSNSLAYSIKISKIKEELDYLSKHDKDILLRVELIKQENQKLSELMQVREELKENKPLHSVIIEGFEKARFSGVPVNKKYRRVIVLAGGLGLLVGMMAVMLMQYVGKGVLTARDIAQLRLLYWGHLERLPENQAEQYQVIRTQLVHDVAAPHTLFAVISAVANSRAVVLALAESLRAIDRRTLVIDADYRSPQETAQGVTSILQGTTAVAAYAGLVQDGVLGLGPVVTNPADVLSKKVFAELLQQARQDYEYVFLLAPQSTTIADTLLIAQQADRLLYIVDPAKTERATLEDMLTTMTKFNTQTAGTIFCHGG